MPFRYRNAIYRLLRAGVTGWDAEANSTFRLVLALKDIKSAISEVTSGQPVPMPTFNEVFPEFGIFEAEPEEAASPADQFDKLRERFDAE